jgi:signal transduction histidine kinase
MRRSRFVLLGAAAGLAVAAEWSAYQQRHDRLDVADGVVGFILLGCGVVAWDRRPRSRVGSLMCLTGVAWFAGTIWSGMLFLHRGPLVHLNLSYPRGRLRWWPAVASVAAAYIASTIVPLAGNHALTIALAVVVASVAGVGFLRTTGTARRARAPAVVSTLAFAGVLALSAVNGLARWDADRELLWAYDTIVAGVAVVLLVDLLRGRWADAVVTNLVVDLGTRADTATLGAALRRSLGDNSLELGYWLADEARYVDDAGNPINITLPDAGRVVTNLERAGQPVAVLVHDADVGDDPRLVDDVAAAARLAVSNARLQAATRERLTDLVASRRRIIEAGDAQRQHLERDLREGVQQHILNVATLLAELRANLDEPCAALLDGLDDELAATQRELEDLARGIHPRVLTDHGLNAALTSLTTRYVGPVQLITPTARLSPAVEAAVYFLCAEALTNVAKHALATRASINIIRADGRIIATIDDDGVGGADERPGAGLRGLADRIEAVGGKLTIRTRDGGGTSVSATIPI